MFRYEKNVESIVVVSSGTVIQLWILQLVVRKRITRKYSLVVSSWASLVAQMVKNLPATWETQV